MPGDDRQPGGLDALQERARTRATSKIGRVTTNSAPASTLYSNRLNSSSRFGAAGIHRHADVKPRRRADRLAADVAAVIEARHQVGQADRVDVEHGGRVRVVADAARVAGDEHQVAQPHRMRAEQIGLDADQVAIATGVVQQRLDARLLLDQHRQRQAADARARSGARRRC